MLRPSRRVPAAGRLLLLLLLAAPAHARVLVLSPESDAAAVVRDAGNGSGTVAPLASAGGRLLVQLGAVAADPDRDLVYVGVGPDPAGPFPGDPSRVLVGRYGVSPLPAGSFNAPVGQRFAALAFDVPGSRLVGIVAAPDDVSPPQMFSVLTHAGSVLDPPAYTAVVTGCCRFASGIAAWRPSTQDLLMVGRRSGDSGDQLLRFAFAGGTSPEAWPIPGDRIVALAFDTQSGLVYALARSALDVTYLARVTWTTPGTPVTLTAVGSAPASCCYVAAGPAAIDGAGSARALYALTRNAQAPAAMSLSAFNLASGAQTTANASMRGYGLWFDAAASFDRIFADGFDG